MSTLQYVTFVEERDAGALPEDCYLRAKKLGLSEIEAIAMLRSVFSLSLLEAKELSIRANTEYASLNESQSDLAAGLPDESL